MYIYVCVIIYGVIYYGKKQRNIVCIHITTRNSLTHFVLFVLSDISISGWRFSKVKFLWGVGGSMYTCYTAAAKNHLAFAHPPRPLVLGAGTQSRRKKKESENSPRCPKKREGNRVLKNPHATSPTCTRNFFTGVSRAERTAPSQRNAKGKSWNYKNFKFHSSLATRPGSPTSPSSRLIRYSLPLPLSLLLFPILFFRINLILLINVIIAFYEFYIRRFVIYSFIYFIINGESSIASKRISGGST